MPPTSLSAPPLTVLGAGAWGTTLAWLLANNGHQVRLWARNADAADAIQRARRNEKYLPGLALPERVTATADLAAALAAASHVFAVVPARALSEVMREARRSGAEPAAVVSCVKGLAISVTGPKQRLRRASELIAAELPGVRVAALSGPNLASEIAAGLPAATTIASADAPLGAELQGLLQQATFRVYTSSD